MITCRVPTVLLPCGPVCQLRLRVRRDIGRRLRQVRHDQAVAAADRGPGPGGTEVQVLLGDLQPGPRARQTRSGARQTSIGARQTSSGAADNLFYRAI